jgi:cytochrome P450
MLEDFLGRGLFNSDGEQWLRQRKNASLEFTKRSLRSFVVDVVQAEVSNRLLPLLRRASSSSEPGTVVLDLQDVLERFAFDTICMVAFGHDPCCLADGGGELAEAKSEFMRTFGEAQDLIVARFLDPVEVSWKIKKWLNVGTERRLKKAIADVHGFAMDIVRARRRQSASAAENRDDVLSRFVASDDDEALRDVVLSFLLAGRETTSSALTWFFWLVSSRPDVVARVADEVREAAAGARPGEAAFELDALRGMHYLHAALTESMRLYPPVPIDTQSCAADDTLPDGTLVRKGWTITYSAYAMGRLEAIWGEDCMEYRPERWLGEDGAFQPASPFRYTVFHAGPRMCLGKEMAYVQMKSIVASVIEEFVVDVVGKDAGAGVPEHVLSVTLRMKGGLPVRVRRRVVAGTA